MTEEVDASAIIASERLDVAAAARGGELSLGGALVDVCRLDAEMMSQIAEAYVDTGILEPDAAYRAAHSHRLPVGGAHARCERVFTPGINSIIKLARSCALTPSPQGAGLLPPRRTPPRPSSPAAASSPEIQEIPQG